MKKVMMLAALLAMVVVAAVPAIAQVSQSNEQEAQSGDATQNQNVAKVCDQQVNQAASASGA